MPRRNNLHTRHRPAVPIDTSFVNRPLAIVFRKTISFLQDNSYSHYIVYIFTWAGVRILFTPLKPVKGFARGLVVSITIPYVNVTAKCVLAKGLKLFSDTCKKVHFHVVGLVKFVTTI